MSIMDNVQPAVKKETRKVAVDRGGRAVCFHATDGIV